MSNARRNRAAPCAALLAALLCLSGCGATVGKLPEWAGGLPENAPQHPAETMPYPNVYEPRPERETKTLTDDEQKRLESELSNLRDAQNKRAIAPPAAEPKDTPKGATKTASKPSKPRPKKVAEKPKPKPPEKKKDDSVVPEQKAPSDLKLMN